MAVLVVVMGLVAAAPTMAQEVGFDDQESESGEIETETEIAIEGNNNSQCAGLEQVGQGGNFSNQQGTSQRDANDEFEQEFEGGEIEFGPENATECEQEVQQAAAASSAKAAPKEEKKAEAKPAPKEEKKAEAKPAPKEEKKAEAKPAPKEEKKAEAKPAPKEEKKAEVKPEAKKEEKKEAPKKKELPPTGGAGIASLLALGAGALLVGGGLLARRIIR